MDNQLENEAHLKNFTKVPFSCKLFFVKCFLDGGVVKKPLEKNRLWFKHEIFGTVSFFGLKHTSVSKTPEQSFYPLDIDFIIFLKHFCMDSPYICKETLSH